MEMKEFQFATSKAGHDKGEVYVLKTYDDEYVYLVNGKSRMMDNPKKKKHKHIQIVHQIDHKLNEKLLLKEQISDNDVKQAIKGFRRK